MEMQSHPAAAQNSTVQHWYGNGRRIAYGSLWVFWTVMLVVVGFSLLSNGSALYGLIALALAVLTGRYAWRIWTWQARRLIFLIIF